MKGLSIWALARNYFGSDIDYVLWRKGGVLFSHLSYFPRKTTKRHVACNMLKSLFHENPIRNLLFQYHFDPSSVHFCNRYGLQIIKTNVCLSDGFKSAFVLQARKTLYKHTAQWFIYHLLRPSQVSTDKQKSCNHRGLWCLKLEFAKIIWISAFTCKLHRKICESRDKMMFHILHRYAIQAETLQEQNLLWWTPRSWSMSEPNKTEFKVARKSVFLLRRLCPSLRSQAEPKTLGAWDQTCWEAPPDHVNPRSIRFYQLSNV